MSDLEKSSLLTNQMAKLQDMQKEYNKINVARNSSKDNGGKSRGLHDNAAPGDRMDPRMNVRGLPGDNKLGGRYDVQGGMGNANRTDQVVWGNTWR